MLTRCKVASVERGAAGHVVRLSIAARLTKSKSMKFWVTAGRAPNVEGLGLEAAGIEYDRKGGVRVR